VTLHTGWGVDTSEREGRGGVNIWEGGGREGQGCLYRDRADRRAAPEAQSSGRWRLAPQQVCHVLPFSDSVS
jgi:hypothetical protein